MDDEFWDGILFGVDPHGFCDFVVLDQRQEKLKQKKNGLTYFSFAFYEHKCRINHNADYAKLLEPSRKKGPRKVKNEEKAPRKLKMKSQRVYKTWMEGNFTPQMTEKYLGPSRTLIRPWSTPIASVE